MFLLLATNVIFAAFISEKNSTKDERVDIIVHLEQNIVSLRRERIANNSNSVSLLGLNPFVNI